MEELQDKVIKENKEENKENKRENKKVSRKIPSLKLSKKTKRIIGAVILLISVYCIYAFIKADQVNNLPQNLGDLANRDKVLYFGSEGASTGVFDAAEYSFYVVENLEDVKPTVNRLRFRTLEYHSVQYSFIDVMLFRYNNPEYADDVYTYYGDGYNAQINRNKLFYTGIDWLKFEILGDRADMFGAHPYYLRLDNWPIVAFDGDHLSSDVDIDDVVLYSIGRKQVIGRMNFPPNSINSLERGSRVIRNIRYRTTAWFDENYKRTELLKDESFLVNNGLQDKFIYMENGDSFYCRELVLAMKVSDIPEDCDLFWDKKIKEKFRDDEKIKNGYIIFAIPFDFDAEYVVKILNGKDYEVSYDGVVVPAEESIDGLEHSISSFDEYKEFTGLDKYFYR